MQETTQKQAAGSAPFTCFLPKSCLAYSSKLQGITTQKPSILYVATLTEGW
jgi:hypothetical protein